MATTQATEPKPEINREIKCVKFLKPAGIYRTAEVAGFQVEVADKLLAMNGVAVLFAELPHPHVPPPNPQERQPSQRAAG